MNAVFADLDVMTDFKLNNTIYRKYNRSVKKDCPNSVSLIDREWKFVEASCIVETLKETGDSPCGD